MDNVVVGHNIAIEFLFSMYRLLNNRGMLDEAAEEIRFKPNEKIEEWAEGNLKNIPAPIREKLEIYFNKESYLGLCLNPLIIEYDIQSVEKLIDLIDGLSSKHILLEFIDTGFGPKNGIVNMKLVEDMLEDEKKAIEFINKNMSIPSRQKWELLQLFLDPDRMKRELNELFVWYYREVFSKNIPEILEAAGEAVKDLSGRLNKYGKEYISLLTNVDYNKTARDDKLIIIVSYYHEFQMFRSAMRNSKTKIYIIGYRYPDLRVESRHAVLGNVQMFKALGDETRLNMARLLSKKPWYGRELAKELGLSNSTVSYHLSFLEANGFVKAESVDNRVYFSLDVDSFKKIINDNIDNMFK